MNQYDKIKLLTEKSDNSPALKAGEIKNILIAEAYKAMPDFELINYRKNCYTFQRVRNWDFNVYETLHIVFSLKNKNIACSIASRVNQNLIHDNSYNNGFLNPHKDLIVLKKGTGMIPMEEAYYFHNGKVGTTTAIVAAIFKDYKLLGIPFLEKQFDLFTNNIIVKTGLTYIQNLTVDKNVLKEEIEAYLKHGKGWISSIKQPLYIDLKETLQRIAGQTKEHRQQMPKLTYELLELYCGIQ